MADDENDDSTQLLLTVDEAARRLHLSRPVIYGLINSGRLRSLLIGRARRIPAQALEDFIARELAASEETANGGDGREGAAARPVAR